MFPPSEEGEVSSPPAQSAPVAGRAGTTAGLFSLDSAWPYITGGRPGSPALPFPRILLAACPPARLPARRLGPPALLAAPCPGRTGSLPSLEGAEESLVFVCAELTPPFHCWSPTPPYLLPLCSRGQFEVFKFRALCIPPHLSLIHI